MLNKCPWIRSVPFKCDFSISWKLQPTPVRCGGFHDHASPPSLYLVTIISYYYLFLPKLMMGKGMFFCWCAGSQLVCLMVTHSRLSPFLYSGLLSFCLPTSAAPVSSMPWWKWDKRGNPIDMRLINCWKTSRFSTDNRFASLSPLKWEK